VTVYQSALCRRPERVIVYRCGLSDSQKAAALAVELPSITETFKQIRADYSPEIAFIITTKIPASDFPFQTHAVLAISAIRPLLPSLTNV